CSGIRGAGLGETIGFISSLELCHSLRWKRWNHSFRLVSHNLVTQLIVNAREQRRHVHAGKSLLPGHRQIKSWRAAVHIKYGCLCKVAVAAGIPGLKREHNL